MNATQVRARPVSERRTPPTTRCPECGSAIATLQVVATCTECEWASLL